MWDGGLPQDPRPPFDYLLTFNIAGLTNEYAEAPIFLRDGKPTLVPTMDELEEIVFPEPIGTLESFTTGGGVSTMPWTFEGRVKTLQNKTVRYPGHFAQLRAFYDLGLGDLEAMLEEKDAEVLVAGFTPFSVAASSEGGAAKQPEAAANSIQHMILTACVVIVGFIHAPDQSSHSMNHCHSDRYNGLHLQNLP